MGVGAGGATKRRLPWYYWTRAAAASGAVAGTGDPDANEINRASPRTQSALLQAMQEQQRRWRASSSPPHHTDHSAEAMQNPIEQEGQPEAQLAHRKCDE
jgi:hypothetical protein